MKLETVDKIVELAWGKPRREIEAIKLLRYETAYGLIDALNYLKDGNIGGAALRERLIRDFVDDPAEQLHQAIGMRDYWQARVTELRTEVVEKNNASIVKDDDPVAKDVQMAEEADDLVVIVDEWLNTEIDRIGDDERMTEAERWDDD